MLGYCDAGDQPASKRKGRRDLKNSDARRDRRLGRRKGMKREEKEGEKERIRKMSGTEKGHEERVKMASGNVEEGFGIKS